MRIRGLKAEEDEDGDTIIKPSELSKLIKNFTGIEIMADPDNFKSTYQILLEISKVWDKLTDAQQALLLEKIAGKHRASVIAGLLSDTEELEKALKAAENSTGSAMTEFEKRTQSIQYHLNQLQNAWQVFSSNAATVGFVNNVIDSLTRLVETMDKIGIVSIGATTGTATLLGVIAKMSPAMIATGKEMLDGKEKISILGKEISTQSKIVQGAVGATGKLSSALSLLKSAIIPLVAVIGTAFAITKIVEWWQDQKYAVDNLTTSIQNLETELNSLQTEYNELASKNNLTAGEEQRLAILEKEIALKEKDLELEKQRKVDTIVKDASAYFNGDKNSLIDSDFVDNMQAADKALKSYNESLKGLQVNGQKIDSINEDLKSLSKTSTEYSQKQQVLSTYTNNYNKAIEDNENAQRALSDALSELYDQEELLRYAIENGNDAQASSAQISLDNLKKKEREIEVVLGLADSEEHLQEVIRKQSDTLSLLTSSIQKWNSGQTVSKSIVEQLISVYPELTDIISEFGEESNNAYSLSEDGVNALNDTQASAMLNLVNNQIAATEETLNQTQVRINAYKEEIRQLANLMNAQMYAGNMTREQKVKEITDKYYKDKVQTVSYKVKDENGQLITKTQKSITKELKGATEAQKNANRAAMQAEINALDSRSEQIKTAQAGLEEAVKAANDQANVLENLRKEKTNLENKIKGSGSNDSVGSTNPSGVDDSGSGSGSNSSKDDEKKIEIWDKYANRIDKVKESLEAYDDAIDLTQSKLEKNQAYEERTNDLMDEESSLYEQLRKQLEEKRKATNDALWQENQDLISLKKNLADITGLDVNSQSFITDLNAWYDQKSLADENFSDSVLGQEIRQKIDAADTLTDHTQELNKELLNTKKEIIDLNDEEITIKFDYQNDILDKYSQQRTIAQTTLDILDNINGAESQRVKLADQLISNYQQENKYLEQAYKENLNYLAKTKQQYTENSQEYIEAARKVAEQNTKLHEQELNNLQSEYNLRKKQLDIQNELNEKAAEYEYYGSAGKEAWEDARQEEIDRLQKELDALDEDNSEEQYLKDLAEKEKQIAELEEKLNNLRSQTTIQQLKPMDDGSYQWEYIVDQKAINETLADLEEARNDLKETQDERALELQKENIQSKIDAIQEEVDEREKQYQRELQLIEDTYESSIDSLDRWLADEVENCNKRIANMEKFNKEYDKTLDTGMKTATATLQANAVALQNTWGTVMSSIVGVIADNVEQALSWIDRMNQALRESQEAAAGGGGDVPGFAKGLKFVESNGMLARLHYGERVLTRSEAAQYNSLEDDIKSGKLQDYFDSLEEDAKVSVSSAISTNISAQKSLPDTTSNTNQFVIENITLPNVNEPADFASELESWASREFGGLAQKAKIKRAK